MRTRQCSYIFAWWSNLQQQIAKWSLLCCWHVKNAQHRPWVDGVVNVSILRAGLRQGVPIVTIWVGVFPMRVNFWLALSSTIFYAANLSVLYHFKSFSCAPRPSHLRFSPHCIRRVASCCCAACASRALHDLHIWAVSCACVGLVDSHLWVDFPHHVHAT